jgi:hypothetical protein
VPVTLRDLWECDDPAFVLMVNAVVERVVDIRRESQRHAEGR